jgi:NTE family protein
MGAIVGGLFAEYPNAAVAWKRLNRYVNDKDFVASWSAFVAKENGFEDSRNFSRFQDILDFAQRKLIALKTVTRPYLQDDARLRRPLENLFQARSFADLKIPLATVGVDLITGKKVVFDTGSLIDGIYASSAIPAVFPPLKQQDMMICDGGGAYRVPVDTCHEQGADFIIAVDIPAFAQQKFSTGLDLILRNNTIVRQRLNDLVLATADLVIRPDVKEFHWANFRAGEACRQRGLEAGRQAMPRLRALLSERKSWAYRLRQQLATMLQLVTEKPQPAQE